MSIAGPVLVATDLSDASDAALREGQAMAARLHATLVICHVLPEIFKIRLLFPHDAGVDTPVQAELAGKARDAVRARTSAVLGPSAADTAHIEIESGTEHAGILEVAERTKAGVIVMAPGATAFRVARATPLPALIARGQPGKGPVVAATDFSDPALPAVQAAADEARSREVPLVLVHCLDIDETAHLTAIGLPGMIPIPPLPQDVIDELETGARDRLDAALAKAGMPGETVLLHRPPGKGVVEAADQAGASLVVVGSRGRTGFSRLALGSVAEAVMGHAHCSVLVVHLHPKT